MTSKTDTVHVAKEDSYCKKGNMEGSMLVKIIHIES